MRRSVTCYKPGATLFAIGHSCGARATGSRNLGFGTVPLANMTLAKLEAATDESLGFHETRFRRWVLLIHFFKNLLASGFGIETMLKRFAL